MTFRGVFKHGVVVPTGEVDLPSGTEVDFTARKAHTRGSRTAKARTPKVPAEPKRKRAAKTKPRKGWLLDVLKPVIGKAKGLPRDYATNLDHYLYGVPKQQP